MSIKRVPWSSSPPTNCDLCNNEITDTFIDGKTQMGAWGNLCPECHKMVGVGLGEGKGQQYEKQPDGTWLKTKP